jgi:hypothetical protein
VLAMVGVIWIVGAETWRGVKVYGDVEEETIV